jgi:hypothetical protein
MAGMGVISARSHFLRYVTRGAEGLIQDELKASYTSSLRPHARGA